MFKHRNNTAHPPFTTDPRGSGITTSASATRTTTAEIAGNRGVAFADGADAHGAPEVAGRKRPRDIRGIVKFREVVYGERGLPRLHAMVARNPILMYPPAHTDEARARLLARRRAAATAATAPVPAGTETEIDEGLMALFEERRAAEAAAAAADGDGEEEEEEEGRSVKGMGNTYGAGAVKRSAAEIETEAQLATYHHRQLDALIGIYYEFNHMTFMKLPMNDTLQMLQRCGKEAVAHCMEFEMHLRMQRETRLRQLDDVAAEESRLAQRRLDAQREALAREVQDAEKALRDLEEDMCEEEGQEHEKEEANVLDSLLEVDVTDMGPIVTVVDVDAAEITDGEIEVLH